jgi:uncharacterized protein
VAERLALFPLSTVLFPGLVLPLHVFEDRYRELVSDLIALPADEPRHFGVIAIRRGREVGADLPDLHEVGCAAEIRRITERPDGKYDLLVTGSQRFRLVAVDEVSHSYFTGDVDWLPDDESGVSALPWAHLVTGRFNEYRELVSGSSTEVEMPDSPRVLSYLVSAAMVLDITDRQQLLAASDAETRLRLLARLLRREITLISELGAIPAVDLLRD